MQNNTGLKIKNIEERSHDAVYLVEIKNGEVISWDGCHSDPQDVEKAYYLWKTLKSIKEDCQYKMLRVKDKVVTLEEFNQEVVPELTENEKFFKNTVLD
mgnify:CR=1 FL=1